MVPHTFPLVRVGPGRSRLIDRRALAHRGFAAGGARWNSTVMRPKYGVPIRNITATDRS